MKIPAVAKKSLKVAFGLLITLLISVAVTALTIIYTPAAFKWSAKALGETSDDSQLALFTELEFRELLNLPDSLDSDEAIFLYLQQQFENSRRKDSFFHRSLKIRFEEGCLYQRYGKHRTMDVFWIIKGRHCRDRHDDDDKRKHDKRDEKEDEEGKEDSYEGDR